MKFDSSTFKFLGLTFLVFAVFTLSSLTIATQQPAKNQSPRFSLENQPKDGIDDGPYIEISKNGLNETIIEDGKVVTKELPLDRYPTKFKAEPSTYKKVSKIAAFSDLHGQYKLAIKILKKNKIIGKNLNWTYGDGHLVIVGDVFDRGDKVTELLWFIFNLEGKAEKQGGKVHYLMGNHEYMIFQDDLRHINKKYKASSELLNTTYPELFGNNTVLGRWLRSKPTIIKINDMLFLHGGISEEFIADGYNINRTNKQMRKSIDVDFNSAVFDSLYGKYHFDTGPIWYRGYFDKEFKKKDFEKVLKKVKVKEIIVGHTSQKKVKSYFDDQLFVVDSSIKNGEYGEILLIENGQFERGTPKGERLDFK